MATVATTSSGHGLSVLTNACSKQSAKSRVKYKVTNYGISDSSKGKFVGVKTVNFDEGFGPEMSAPEVVSRWTMESDFDTSPTKDVLDEDLGSLSNDEFYNRLLQLKQEHKKTLQLCEKLYRQKLATDRSVDFDRDNVVEDDTDRVLNGHVSRSTYLADSQEIERENIKPQDRIKDLSSKPPIPAQRHLGAQSIGLNRPFSAPVRRQNLSRSLDVDDWRLMAQHIQVPDGVRYYNEETQSEIYDPREAAAAMARIEDMWESFSVDDYAPRGRRSRRPSSAHSDLGPKQPKKKEWRHRITIPQPFEMTLRDSYTEKPKSKTQILHEQEIFQKQQEEEAECQKKFKARPVPAHVYLPLFDEYNEKNDARRRYVRHYRKELLKSIEKPFKFMSREEEKKRRQMVVNSIPLTDDVEYRPQFRAKPVPDYLYDSSNEDKALEEQEYRRIRIKMRAQEMMKSASLPPSMEARQKMKEQRLKEEKKKTKTRRRKFVPHINGEVPDYDELYRQFQKELQKRKLGREATVMEPFKLRTGKISSKKEKILNDVKRDEDSLVETRWPYRNPRTTPRKSFVSGATSSSLDSIPHRTSSSAEMRFNKGRSRALCLSQRELEEIEYHKRQRQKEMKLRKEIMERTSANERDLQPRPSQAEKLREYREGEKVRMAEYRQSLEDIKQRVSQRPLLFEQVKQANAKKAAEKRYSRTLRDHGLDETYVQQKSSLSTGVDTDGDYSDVDDQSYSYKDNRDERSGDEETVVKVNTRDSEDQLSA